MFLSEIKKDLIRKEYYYNFTTNKEFLIARKRSQLILFKKKGTDYVFVLKKNNKSQVINWIEINKYIIKLKHDHQLIFIFWSKF